MQCGVWVEGPQQSRVAVGESDEDLALSRLLIKKIGSGPKSGRRGNVPKGRVLASSASNVVLGGCVFPFSGDELGSRVSHVSSYMSCSTVDPRVRCRLYTHVVLLTQV